MQTALYSENCGQASGSAKKQGRQAADVHGFKVYNAWFQHRVSLLTVVFSMKHFVRLLVRLYALGHAHDYCLGPNHIHFLNCPIVLRTVRPSLLLCILTSSSKKEALSKKLHEI